MDVERDVRGPLLRYQTALFVVMDQFVTRSSVDSLRDGLHAALSAADSGTFQGCSPKKEVGGTPETSAGSMPTEARGNYLPEPPYLRETKTYHSHQPVESMRHAGNFLYPAINTAHFYFFVVAEVMSHYLTTDWLKKNFSTSGGPHEA